MKFKKNPTFHDVFGFRNTSDLDPKKITWFKYDTGATKAKFCDGDSCQEHERDGDSPISMSTVLAKGTSPKTIMVLDDGGAEKYPGFDERLQFKKGSGSLLLCEDGFNASTGQCKGGQFARVRASLHPDPPKEPQGEDEFACPDNAECASYKEYPNSVPTHRRGA